MGLQQDHDVRKTHCLLKILDPSNITTSNDEALDMGIRKGNFSTGGIKAERHFLHGR